MRTMTLQVSLCAFGGVESDIYSLKIVENPECYFMIIVDNSECPHGVVK